MAERTLSTRKKQSSAQFQPPSIDRLSDLPDSLLSHILSFLPAEIAAATSVLAKRWRSLWTEIPCLSFDYHNPKTEHSWNSASLDNKSNKQKLSDIVNIVLLLHKARCLTSFRLVSDENHNPKQFYGWMAAVVSRNVRMIDVSLDYHFNSRFWLLLPQSLFTCKTLVDLKLHKRVIIPAKCVFRLPCLKKLVLDDVKYENTDSLPYLISGCSVLEDLILRSQLDSHMLWYIISSPTLIRLVVDFSLMIDYPPNPHYTLMINTPALRFLKIDYFAASFIQGGGLFRALTNRRVSNIIEAVICLNDSSVSYDINNYHLPVIKFVEVMRNVRSLKLRSLRPNREFIQISDATVRFEKLTKLDLTFDWYFLGKFLELADNLEVLIIRKVGYGLKCWKEPDNVPKCMISCLRTVMFYDDGDEQDDLNLLGYILYNAKVLSRMEAKFDVIRRISLFPRGSGTCELVEGPD